RHVARARVLPPEHFAGFSDRVVVSVARRRFDRIRDWVAAAILYDLDAQLRLIFGAGVFLRAVPVDCRDFSRLLAVDGIGRRFLTRGGCGQTEYHSGAENRI